jgi:hypothetical protein
MKTYLIGGLALLVIVAAVGGYIYYQASRLEEQGAELGRLAVVSAAQQAVITELRDAKQRDDVLVVGTADRIDKLTTRIQSLDRRTQEALRNAPNLTLDSVLPADAADALCMQWRAASGISANTPGDAAGGADARTGDTPAPGCGNWRRMTVRDAVEWNGLLLKHAGLEREDKAALRQWALGVNKDGGE